MMKHEAIADNARTVRFLNVFYIKNHFIRSLTYSNFENYRYNRSNMGHEFSFVLLMNFH